MTAALGLSRAELDAWRQAVGLPSRRWLDRQPQITDRVETCTSGPARHDILSGRLHQWRLWRRVSLPSAGMRVVGVRTVADELYWELG